jgi:hypothetical protein
LPGWLITLKGMQPAFDAVASASLLGFAKTELSRGVDLAQSLLQAPLQAWYGSRPGSLGETASWLIAAGGVAMIFLRTITWHIPVAMLLGIAVPAAILHAIDPARYLDAVHPSAVRWSHARRLLHRHRLCHLAQHAARTTGLRCWLRRADLRDPHLGRLPGRRGLRRAADELLDPDHRQLHQAAHLRTRSPGAALEPGK